MSIQIIKRLTFTVGASLIALSSINVAHAYPTSCAKVGGSAAGAPTACADCHTGGNASGNNYRSGCTVIAPPPAPTPAPAPAPAPGGGGNTGGNTGGHQGNHHMDRNNNHRGGYGRNSRDNDRRGGYRRHSRDD